MSAAHKQFLSVVIQEVELSLFTFLHFTVRCVHEKRLLSAEEGQAPVEILKLEQLRSRFLRRIAEFFTLIGTFLSENLKDYINIYFYFPFVTISFKFEIYFQDKSSTG